jgi:hypothetical protein
MPKPGLVKAIEWRRNVRFAAAFHLHSSVISDSLCPYNYAVLAPPLTGKNIVFTGLQTTKATGPEQAQSRYKA